MKQILCPVSCEELRHLVENAKLTDKGIADHLPGGTVHRVQAWRKQCGIESIPRWSRNEVPPIEGRLRSLLIGSMLGDGRLVRRTHATHYTENHTDTQKPYLEWKIQQWGSWVTSDAIKPVTWNTGGKSFPGWRFNTLAHADLNEWRDLFYADPDKGWKRLLPRVVDLVDELALAVWYLDDGYAGWWPGVTFGADEVSRQVAFSIFEKFGLIPRWVPKVGNTGEFIFEGEAEAIHFIDIIKPHVPDCMGYKIGSFGFQGPHYQIRQRVTESVLRDLVSSGTPIRKIAEQLGVGFATVDRWLDKFGIQHSRVLGRPPKEHNA